MPSSLLILLALMLAEIRLLVGSRSTARPKWIDILLAQLGKRSDTAEADVRHWKQIRQQLGSVYAQLATTGLGKSNDIGSRSIEHIQRVRLWSLDIEPPTYCQFNILQRWHDLMRQRVQFLLNLYDEPNTTFVAAMLTVWDELEDREQRDVIQSVWNTKPFLVGERARMLYTLAAQVPVRFRDTFYQYINHGIKGERYVYK
jgi:hypothetical protein